MLLVAQAVRLDPLASTAGSRLVFSSRARPDSERHCCIEGEQHSSIGSGGSWSNG
jgi:hypothetical protein